MKGAYFISDLHIVSPDCVRARVLVRFLRSLSVANASHLVLLGDIFDLWVADHGYFIDRFSDIIDEIRRLRDDGVEVHYFEGNHDLHLRYFWADELGITVHGEATYTEMADRTLRLEHGDQMDPDDTGYLFLRWFLRTAPIRFLIRHLPGRLVARVGERASETSRHYTSNSKTIDDAEAIRKIRIHAEKAFADRPFDLIISGHVHVRDDWLSPGKGFRSVNLGSWLDRPCYFRVDADSAGFFELDSNEESDVSNNDSLAATGS